MITLVMPSHVAIDIDRAARHPLETAGVLIGAVVETPDQNHRVLVQDVVWVDESAYLRREPDGLSIASQGYVTALGEAERRGSMALWFHTHPGNDGIPLPSAHDHQVDSQIADLFRLRTGSPFYGTVIASPRYNGVTFSGTLQPEGQATIPIDRFWLLASPWRMLNSFNVQHQAVAPIFDRNVRAFGPAIQHILGGLRVGIIGCGGTGSCVAEQLVRLGIRHVLLVDADTLSLSNVTRVYGSTPARVGDLKVEVLKDHLTAIAPDLHCAMRASTINMESAVRAMMDCDVLFGCTDDNAGRLVLSRVATYLLTPVIDVGVLLSSDKDLQLIGIDGRVTVLTPGSACLVCRDRIDLARAAAEVLTPEERRARADEGYAPALAGSEPAVVAFTTAVAAAAVNELLERLIGYGAKPQPTEILLRLHEREISTNIASSRPGHYCHASQGLMGRGNIVPFLGQTWPAP
jgi:molybdopterin/thiamine biosynthesis adenylyltransferase/proteasome lid subunit RPN8/RPN11